MRLTVYSDYALRLLMFLAVRTDKLATIPEVAKANSISANHLMKVVHSDGAGGLRRDHSRSQWRHATGPARSGNPSGRGCSLHRARHGHCSCFQTENRSCPLRRACLLKGALDRARQAFLAVLDDYTIGDLTSGGAPLRLVLGIDAGPEVPIAPGVTGVRRAKRMQGLGDPL